MARGSSEFKVGDRIVITKTPPDYYYFSEGAEAILTFQDGDGDWWANFVSGDFRPAANPLVLRKQIQLRRGKYD